MINAILRRATPPDVPALSALLTAYYDECDIWVRDEPAYIRAAIADPPLGYFLAVVDKVPVACIHLRTLPIVPAGVECKRLFVLPEHRGRRLAARLMDLAEDVAHDAGYTWVYLDAKPDFIPAIALFRRRGYQDVARFSTNPQATVFLRKRLTLSPL